MREIAAIVTSGGRVTLPRAVRLHLQLARRDQLVFAIADDASITARALPRSPVTALAGAAGSLGREAEWDEIRAIAREDHLAAKYPRP